MNAAFYFVFIDDFINFSPLIGRFKHIYFRMKENKLFNILRWIGILPATIIVMLVSNWLGEIAQKWFFVNYLTGEYTDGGFIDYMVKTIAGCISIAATYEFGKYMAPTHKRKTGITICILWIIICVASLIFLIAVNWTTSKIIPIIGIIIVIIVTVKILIGDLRKKESEKYLS